MAAAIPRRVAALSLGFLLVGSPVAVWWSISPYETMRGIAAASYDGDETAFRAYLDIPQIRANALRRVEEDLHDALKGSRSVRLDDHAIASAIMGPAINRALSESSTFDLVHRKDHASGRDIVYLLVRDDANHFHVTFIAPRPLTLKFHRTGLRWRIVDAWVERTGSDVT